MVEPKIVTDIPGPRSRRIWKREKRHITTGLAPCTLIAPVVFDRGEGSIIWDVDGNSYIDFAAGVLTNSTGHCHPDVVRHFREQAGRLWHVHDFPTPERYKLCELLAKKCPAGIDTVEFYNGGTETVEAAMRAAVSFTRKYEFLAFHNAYHGKTLGARMLAWKKGFGPVPSAVRAPYAYCYRCSFKLTYPQCELHCADYIGEAVGANVWGNVAAIVFEPIIGAGGVIVPPKGYWQKVSGFCRANKILMIADEVLTGVGRTGRFLSCENFGIKPDLVAFGKGLGSGFPVMVLAGKRAIMTAKPYGSPGGASTSFGGNPLAVAAALATLETIDRDEMLQNVRSVGKYLGERLSEMKTKHPLIGDVRGMGLLWGVELVKDRKTKEPAGKEGEELYVECLKRGLKTITPAHVSRLSPPLNIPMDLARKAMDIYDTALGKIERRHGMALQQDSSRVP